MHALRSRTDNDDAQEVARLCEQIENEDWYFGPLEDKLRLIVALADRLALAAGANRVDPTPYRGSS
jgi:hypothetical protein